jgi:hypothetical protein
VAWAAESAGRAKASIVDQDDQNVWGTLGRTQLGDRWVLVFRIFSVVQHQASSRWVWNGKNGSLDFILVIHASFLSFI